MKTETYAEDSKVTSLIIHNIQNYLYWMQTCIINQLLIGFDNLFYSLIVKQWTNIDKTETYYQIYNKIIVCKAIEFYSLSWADRNKKHNNKSYQQ